MTDVYVGPGGTDTDGNGGAIGTPYKSLNYALEQARTTYKVAPGDTVWMLDGTHTDVGDGIKFITSTTYVIGTSDTARVTIKAYPGHTPVCEYRIYLKDYAHYITIDGLTFDTHGLLRTAGVFIGDAGDTDSPDIQIGTTIQNCTFQNAPAANVSIDVARGEDFIIQNNTFDNNRPRINNITNLTEAKSIRFPIYAVNGLIKNNSFTDIGGDCLIFGDLYLTDDYSEIRNITIENNDAKISKPYVYRDPYGVKYPISPTYQTISGNTYNFSDGGYTITRTAGTTDLDTIEDGSTIDVIGVTNNDRTYTVAHTTATTITTKEATTSETSTATLETFNASVCGENFLDCKYADSNIVIRNNKISNYRKLPPESDSSGADGSAIVMHLSAAGNFTINNNEVVDCNKAVVIGASTSGQLQLHGTKIYNNIYRDTYFYNADGVVKEPIQIEECAGVDCFNNTVHVKYNTAVKLLTTGGTDGTSDIRIYNNIFVSNGSGYGAGAAGDAESGYNCWYNSVPVVQASATDVDDNPLLDQNNRPSTNSPMINAGVKPLSDTDFYGLPVTGNHIGAVGPKVDTVKERRKV